MLLEENPMTSHSAFDYATPYDIMVGYWVGTANIYGPKGVYAMSTKSHVAVFWEKRYTKLSFRESAEDYDEFQGAAEDYLDSRRAEEQTITGVLGSKTALAAVGTLRVLAYDLDVNGPYCEGGLHPVHVTGIQTRPDVYQFHVKKKENGDYHHVYNSHHLPSPDDWHIIGPIVGRIAGKDGEVGVAVVQNFRRISYDVPKASIRKLV
jgi:hypothetical protein